MREKAVMLYWISYYLDRYPNDQRQNSREPRAHPILEECVSHTLTNSSEPLHAKLKTTIRTDLFAIRFVILSNPVAVKVRKMGRKPSLTKRIDGAGGWLMS